MVASGNEGRSWLDVLVLKLLQRNTRRGSALVPRLLTAQVAIGSDLMMWRRWSDDAEVAAEPSRQAARQEQNIASVAGSEHH
jgi:hypothetical protein